ncbi:hypothetical protein DITRI_Ditri02bG0165700 [Diplodiscus trichospermus]
MPEVLDFGFTVADSIVSITATRGTLEDIAPNLVYKNIGGVSYEDDIYSFGLEFVEKRKDLNAFVEHPSEIYVL